MIKRFDLAQAGILQSRDGSLTKGGLITNGFAEKNRAGVWNWQRPALSSGEEAPLTGNGLGMYLVGNTIWGLYHNGTGTATSGVMNLGAVPFTLVAGSIGATEFGFVSFGGIGSISPSTIKGKTVSRLSVEAPADPELKSVNFQVSELVAQSYYTRLTLNGISYFTADAAWSQGATTSWTWQDLASAPIVGVGTYGGNVI